MIIEITRVILTIVAITIFAYAAYRITQDDKKADKKL